MSLNGGERDIASARHPKKWGNHRHGGRFTPATIDALSQSSRSDREKREEKAFGGVGTRAVDRVVNMR